MEVESEKVGMADAPAKQCLVRRSKRLPQWLWISIAHALGIRTKPSDRSVVATVLYASTMISALGMMNCLGLSFAIVLPMFEFCAKPKSIVLVASTSTYVIAEVIQTRVAISKSANQTRPTVLLESGSKSVGITDRADVMDGIAMVSLTIFWCLLGLYSKNLAYRLYNSSKFLDMVRLHAKVSLLIIIFFFLTLLTYYGMHNRTTPT